MAEREPQDGDRPPPRPVAVAWPPGLKVPDDPIMQARIAAGAIAEIIDPDKVPFARVRGI